MKRAELYARLLVVTVATAAVALPLISWARTPLMHARVAEDGGWSLQDLRAQVGVPFHLRMTSDDVTHGFAVGKLNMAGVDVLPGKVTDVTLLFDKPGTYTFYCTRWCGVNHWRMRGTVEVSGPQAITPAEPPLYVALGLDLDAAREIRQAPLTKPVAGIVSGQLAGDLAAHASVEYYRSHSPEETWQALREDPAFSRVNDADAWNLVASIWRSNATPASRADGARLFAQNCAACHGGNGAGDGVFADDVAAANQASMQGMGAVRPVDFTNPARLLSASPALLQGKILRGGMGTGMPSWGPIFTEEQTWNLVAYLYAFQFDYR